MLVLAAITAVSQLSNCLSAKRAAVSSEGEPGNIGNVLTVYLDGAEILSGIIKSELGGCRGH